MNPGGFGFQVLAVLLLPVFSGQQVPGASAGWRGLQDCTAPPEPPNQHG